MNKTQIVKLSKKDPLVIKLEKAKNAYCVALALKETLHKDTEKLNAPLDKAVEEKKISVDDWATKTVDNEYKTGYADAQDIYYTAKKALLEIGKEITLKLCPPEHLKDVTAVWTDGLRFFKIRDKLTELVLTLDPTL